MIVNYDFQFLCQLLLVGTGRATCFFFPPTEQKPVVNYARNRWKKVNLLKKTNKQKKLPEFKVCIIL